MPVSFFFKAPLVYEHTFKETAKNPNALSLQDKDIEKMSAPEIIKSIPEDGQLGLTKKEKSLIHDIITECNKDNLTEARELRKKYNIVLQSVPVDARLAIKAPISDSEKILRDIDRDYNNPKYSLNNESALTLRREEKLTPAEKEIHIFLTQKSINTLGENNLEQLLNDRLKEKDVPSPEKQTIIKILDKSTLKDEKDNLLKEYRISLSKKLNFASEEKPFEAYKEFLKKHLLVAVTDKKEKEYLADAVAHGIHQSGLTRLTEAYYSIQKDMAIDKNLLRPSTNLKQQLQTEYKAHVHIQKDIPDSPNKEAFYFTKKDQESKWSLTYIDRHENRKEVDCKALINKYKLQEKSLDNLTEQEVNQLKQDVAAYFVSKCTIAGIGHPKRENSLAYMNHRLTFEESIRYDSLMLKNSFDLTYNKEYKTELAHVKSTYSIKAKKSTRQGMYDSIAFRAEKLRIDLTDTTVSPIFDQRSRLEKFFDAVLTMFSINRQIATPTPPSPTATMKGK